MYNFNISLLSTQFSSIATGAESVIFDYDGTIAHIPINWKSARQGCFDHLMLKFSDLPIEATQRVDEMEALALTDYPSEAAYILAFRSQIESAIDGGHKPIDAVIDLLQQIHLRYDCYIVSNNLSSTVVSGLTSLGLLHCFKGIYGVDTVGLPKPATTSIDLLQKNYGLDTRTTVMLGDSPSTDGKYCELLNIDFLNITSFV